MENMPAISVYKDITTSGTMSNAILVYKEISDWAQIFWLFSDFRLLFPKLSDFVRLCPTLSDFVRLCLTLSEMVPKLMSEIISLRNGPWPGSSGPAHVPDDLSGTYNQVVSIDTETFKHQQRLGYFFPFFVTDPLDCSLALSLFTACTYSNFGLAIFRLHSPRNRISGFVCQLCCCWTEGANLLAL